MSSYNAWSAWAETPANPRNSDTDTGTGWRGSTWSSARNNDATIEETPRTRASCDYWPERDSSNSKRKFSDYVDDDSVSRSREPRRRASQDARDARDPRDPSSIPKRDASRGARDTDRMGFRLADRLADYERRNSNSDMDSANRPARQWGRPASPRDTSRGQGELANRGRDTRECAYCQRTSHEEHSCPDGRRAARNSATADRDKTPEVVVSAEDSSSLASRISPNRSDGKLPSRAGTARNSKEDKFRKQRQPAESDNFLACKCRHSSCTLDAG